MSLTVALAEIWAEIASLRKRLVSVSPATVTGVNPVRIQVDGQSAPVAASPDSLVPVGPGDRVRVLRYGTTHLILGRVGTSGRPWRQAAGRLEISGTGEPTAGASTVLPAGRFTVTPLVMATPHSSVYLAYRGAGTSATELEVGVRRYDGQPFTSTVTVDWVAVQMTPTSADG